MTAARMRWDAYETVDGVLCKPGRQEERTAFSQETADRLLRIEDVSWWFQYRMELIAQIADRFLAKEKAVFDIGGGNGYTSKALQQRGWEAVLLEPSLPECRNANMRGVQTVVCNALNAQDFPAESVPQAVLLDVLEHIEQETVMLELLHDSVQSGGQLSSRFRHIVAFGQAKTMRQVISGAIGATNSSSISRRRASRWNTARISFRSSGCPSCCFAPVPSASAS